MKVTHLETNHMEPEKHAKAKAKEKVQGNMQDME